MVARERGYYSAERSLSESLKSRGFSDYQLNLPALAFSLRNPRGEAVGHMLRLVRSRSLASLVSVLTSRRRVPEGVGRSVTGRPDGLCVHHEGDQRR